MAEWREVCNFWLCWHVFLEEQTGSLSWHILFAWNAGRTPTVVFCFLFSFISWQTRPHTCFSLKMFANDQIVGFSIENLAIIVFGFKHFKTLFWHLTVLKNYQVPGDLFRVRRMVTVMFISTPSYLFFFQMEIIKQKNSKEEILDLKTNIFC